MTQSQILDAENHVGNMIIRVAPLGLESRAEFHARRDLQGDGSRHLIEGIILRTNDAADGQGGFGRVIAGRQKVIGTLMDGVQCESTLDRGYKYPGNFEVT